MASKKDAKVEEVIEEVVVGAVDEPKVKEEQVDRKPIKALPPRMHVEGFLKMAGLSEMEEAGFKVFCKKSWMREKEWKAELQKYKERK